MSKKITANIAANVTGRACGFISIYLFVPLYLKFLGIEAYGLVGFYSTLLGVLALADLGFTATLSREMARLSVRKDSNEEMRDLLRTYESTYICISTVLAIIIWTLAPWISEKWLSSKSIQPQEIASTIRLMGVAIAFQLPSGLYIGGLMGLQRQVLANSVQIAWGVYRGVGTVLVLWLLFPTIIAFSLWQIISNALYCFFARFSLWHAVTLSPTQPYPKFKWQVFHNTWRYAAGMAAMAVVSTLLTQADKLVISKMLSLEMLGYYSLAGSLASIPLVLASPIATAVFPRLTELVAIGDRIGLTQLYHRTCELLTVAILPGGLTLALFAGDLILAWTGSVPAAQKVGLVASLLTIGQIMQAVALIPYYLALAHGNVRLYLYIGIDAIALVIPLMIILVLKVGIAGAGWSLLIMNLFTLPTGIYFLHRHFMSGELRRWYLQDLGLPLLAALPCVVVGRLLVPRADSRISTLCLIVLVWGLSSIATAATIPELRAGFMKQIHRFFWVSNETK